ncbi:hypothetical protein GCM10028808_53780 [Spirosoma migulaei]
MHLQRYSWLCLLITVCSIACKKDVEEIATPPDQTLSWQLDNDFLFDEKTQLNSYADTSLIILSGAQTTSIAPGEQQSKYDTTFTHYGGQAQPNGRTDYRPCLSSSFIAFLNDDRVNVIPTASPVLARGNDYVRMSQLDADFAGFITLAVNQGESMVVNGQNQLIIPYQRYDRSYSTPVINGANISLVLLSINVPAWPNLGLDVTKTQLITLEGAGFPYSMGSAGDYFIVSTVKGTFRISPNGVYEKTYPYGLLRQFSYNGTVYGVTYANSTSLQLVASTDQGKTWSVVANQVSDTYRLLVYKQVNNLLIGMYNSQLFQLQLTATTLTPTELDNTNLFGNRITSVAAFHNTVYVSTLSGVFTKPLRTFLTPKKEK